MMQFKVLGPLEVCRNGRALEVPGGKPRAVLAFLLLHANEPVSAERLAVALWGEDAPARAVKTVQVYVSRLRRALGDEAILTTSAAGYRLCVASGALDADWFGRLVAEGQRALSNGEVEEAAALLREALALWRGPPLADLSSLPFAATEIARLEEQRLAAVEARIEADLAAGRHAELVSELQALVGAHSLRERLHGQLMLALYRTGRQSEALAAYRRARELLVEELGIEPGVELRALEQAILAHNPELMLIEQEALIGHATPRPGSPGGGRVRVPRPPTRTVGRAVELALLQAVVAEGDRRLVTVVGAGGVGKTRVAMEVAQAIGRLLRDGAVFVSLAAVAESEHVASTIAGELGVNLAPSESVESALVRHLARRQLLLVLDNFEHVLEAATLAADLVAAAPELKVLATSREPLRLRAERLFHLDPLAVAPANGAPEAAPAVELFVDTARARDPAFTFSESNAGAIADVCRRLDGLPLAIELAAARVGLLSVSELAERLRSGLEACDVGPRDAPRRQRTLTATLEWSYALLDANEQGAVVGLAVFAGGCTLEAAELVTGAALEVFEDLVAKNLVVADAGPDGEPRLRMLETVRAFAGRRLEQHGDGEAVRRRHCEYYLGLAEQAQPELERTASPVLVAEIDLELDNMRAAFAWALEHAPALALRIASATAMYWYVTRLKNEAVDWLAAALAVADEAVPVAVRAAALQHYAINLEKASTIELAERAARESLALRQSLNDLSGCARSSWVLAHVLVHAYRKDEAHHLATEALRLADIAGDRQARVWALSTLALTAPTLPEALSFGEQASAELRAAGNLLELAAVPSSVAYTALGHGDYATAETLSRDALDAARARGDPWVVAMAEGNFGLAALFNGALTSGEQAFITELRLGNEYGFDSEYGGFLAEAINGLAAVSAARGHDRAAATLSGIADATGERPDPSVARRLDECFFAEARARLGERPWQEAHAAGYALDVDHALEIALEASGE